MEGTIVCPKCGTENDARLDYCEQCSERLHEEDKGERNGRTGPKTGCRGLVVRVVLVANGLPLLVVGLLLVNAPDSPGNNVGSAILISGVVLLIGALLPWRQIVRLLRRS